MSHRREESTLKRKLGGKEEAQDQEDNEELDSNDEEEGFAVFKEAKEGEEAPGMYVVRYSFLI
jgi:hypothetical protein